MAKIVKPEYDYSFIKNISSHGSDYTGTREGDGFYDDLTEVLRGFESNLENSSRQLIIPLFERGFQTYIAYEGKLRLYFGPYKDSPGISEMVLKSKNTHPECKSFLESHFDLDYAFLTTLRDATNNKKHERFQKIFALNKKLILEQIFSFFTQLYENINGVKMPMPSNDFLDYYSSTDKFAEDRIETINKELNKEAAKAKREKKKAEDDLLSALEEKETVDATIEESRKILSTVSSELDRKEKELKELDEKLSRRKTDLSLNVSSMANNDLSELASGLISQGDFEAAKKVFNNILNANIQDLRGYIGLILCLYKAIDIDSLIAKSGESRIHLINTQLYDDSQKFLKPEDKEYIKEIANTIENEIAFFELKEEAMMNNFDVMETKIEFLETHNSYFDLREYKTFVKHEPIYLKAKNLFNLKQFDEAIALIESIIPYKDSEQLSIKWSKEKTEFLKEEEKRKKELEKSEAERKARAERLEKERLEQEERRIAKNAEDALYKHYFDQAIEGFKILGNLSRVEVIKKCKRLYAKYEDFRDGKITKDEYLLERKKYSSEVVEIVERFGSNLDKIEAKYKIQQLLDKRTFKDFLEAYSLARLYSYYHSDYDFSQCILDIASKNLDIEFIKCVYIEDRVPYAKRDFECGLDKCDFIASEKTIDYGISYLEKDTKLYRRLVSQKERIVLDKIETAHKEKKYDRVVKLCESKEIREYVSQDTIQNYYCNAIFCLKDAEAIKNINFLTDEKNRNWLIKHLDEINEQRDADIKELDFLRFLVSSYKNTKYSRLLEQVLLYACFARTHPDHIGVYGVRWATEFKGSSSATQICAHIQHIDRSILERGTFKVDESLVFENEGVNKFEVFEGLKRLQKTYDSVNKKHVMKWCLKLVLSFLLPIGIAMIIIGANMLRPSGEPVSIGGNVLLILGIPSVLAGVIFFICTVAENPFDRFEANSYFDINKLFYKVCSLKMSLVYGIDSKIDFDKDSDHPSSYRFADIDR